LWLPLALQPQKDAASILNAARFSEVYFSTISLKTFVNLCVPFEKLREIKNSITFCHRFTDSQIQKDLISESEANFMHLNKTFVNLCVPFVKLREIKTSNILPQIHRLNGFYP